MKLKNSRKGNNMVSFFSVVMLCSITILPAGDSITAGFHEKPTGSYRYWLEQKFMTNNIDYDFIGELSRGGSYMVDANHHGIPGAKIEELAEIPFTRKYSEFDVALVLAGTNNHWNAPDHDEFVKKYSDLICAFCPHTVIFASPPKFGMKANGPAYWTQEWVNGRNELTFPAMRSAIQQVADQNSNVYFVDFFEKSDPFIHLTADGVHLNSAGHQILAELFFNKMTEIGLVSPEPATMPLMISGVVLLLLGNHRLKSVTQTAA